MLELELEILLRASRLIRDALEAGRIRRKDPHATSSKFTEYLPYWG